MSESWETLRDMAEKAEAIGDSYTDTNPAAARMHWTQAAALYDGAAGAAYWAGKSTAIGDALRKSAALVRVKAARKPEPAPAPPLTGAEVAAMMDEAWPLGGGRKWEADPLPDGYGAIGARARTETTEIYVERRSAEEDLPTGWVSGIEFVRGFEDDDRQGNADSAVSALRAAYSALLADLRALGPEGTETGEPVRLRAVFDETRHRVLRAMGESDMGHGWGWIEMTLAERAKPAPSAPPSRTVADVAREALDLVDSALGDLRAARAAAGSTYTDRDLRDRQYRLADELIALTRERP